MPAFIASSVLIVIIIALAIPLLAIAAPILIVWMIVRAVTGRPRRARKVEANETRIMQEIHRGLSKMEQRIDNLETILLEQQRDRTKDTAGPSEWRETPAPARMGEST